MIDDGRKIKKENQIGKAMIMTLEEIMKILDIESGEDFLYFDQFAALMETETEIDYDTFVELLMMPEAEALSEMIGSFFEDMIKGIPDDDTDLYSAVQTQKDAILSLAGLGRGRSFGFLTDELFRFRQWYLTPEAVVCTPEAGGERLQLTPCEALTLFRQEKLSGDKYFYDFSAAIPEPPDEYLLDRIAEMTDFSDEYGADNEEAVDMLPDELPDEYDPTDFDPDLSPNDRPIDPYTEGFVDRFDPVIEGEGLETFEEEGWNGQ